MRRRPTTKMSYVYFNKTPVEGAIDIAVLLGFGGFWVIAVLIGQLRRGPPREVTELGTLTSFKNLPQTTKDKMHRLSPNNPVRRRLFASDLDDQARIDNFANVLQETAVRDRFEMMQKWNFDFENETPLPGNYEWCRCDGDNNWIGMKGTRDATEVEENLQKDNNCLPIKDSNELTPKTENEERMPLIRKRRKEVGDNKETGKGVRRKISFD